MPLLVMVIALILCKNEPTAIKISPRIEKYMTSGCIKRNKKGCEIRANREGKMIKRKRPSTVRTSPTLLITFGTSTILLFSSLWLAIKKFKPFCQAYYVGTYSK
jgi:hypothetical protein